MLKWLRKLFIRKCNHSWKYTELKDNHRRTVQKYRECSKCGVREYLSIN